MITTPPVAVADLHQVSRGLPQKKDCVQVIIRCSHGHVLCMGSGFLLLLLFCLILLFLTFHEYNNSIHLDLDTWIVPGQIRKANFL